LDFPRGDHFAADVDLAPGEVDLALDLAVFLPAGVGNGGRDELGADVRFAQITLIQGG
jgi:hypothetical protein